MCGEVQSFIYGTITAQQNVTIMTYAPPLCKYALVYPIDANVQVDCYINGNSTQPNTVVQSNLFYFTINTSINDVTFGNSGLNVSYNSNNGSYQIQGNITSNQTIISAPSNTSNTHNLIWDNQNQISTQGYPMYQSIVVTSS